MAVPVRTGCFAEENITSSGAFFKIYEAASLDRTGESCYIDKGSYPSRLLGNLKDQRKLSEGRQHEIINEGQIRSPSDDRSGCI